MAVELVDTHAHLNVEHFAEDCPQVIARAAEAGVRAIICVGIEVETSRRAVELAQEHPEVFAVVGIHPNSCGKINAGDWERIVELASADGVVGLGETGVDRYWDDCPVAVQRESFARHLALSRETGLPFVVHCREAEADTLEELQADFQQNGPLNGVMHSFSGTLQTAEACLQMGMFISFAGMVTYKKSQPLRDVAVAVPADRLLVETDCPYLSPEPVRKIRRNEPAHVRHTASLLAEVRHVPLEQLAAQTTQNAHQLFRLP